MTLSLMVLAALNDRYIIRHALTLLYNNHGDHLTCDTSIKTVWDIIAYSLLTNHKGPWAQCGLPC